MSMFSEMFAGPTGDRFKPAAHKGDTVLFHPHSYEEGIKTKYSVDGSTSDAIRCDAYVLKSDGTETVYNDTLVFQGRYIGAMKSRIGSSKPYLLGKIGQADAKSGVGTAWTLEEFSDDDAAWAESKIKGIMTEQAEAELARREALEASKVTPF